MHHSLSDCADVLSRHCLDFPENAFLVFFFFSELSSHTQKLTVRNLFSRALYFSVCGECYQSLQGRLLSVFTNEDNLLSG